MLETEHYKVSFPVFEGPLDLLLYLIRQNDLNIYDIPIAFMAEEYLRHLEIMRELDIDVAGDFLMMAAELAKIKSQMLLPGPVDSEEEEGPDPRAELARRLIEYQRFKIASQDLQRRLVLGRDIFVRPPAKLSETERGGIPATAEVFQLIEAFSHIVRRLPKEAAAQLQGDRLSISERIFQIEEVLKKTCALRLEDLLSEPLHRYDVVITFLALLEMTRLQMIRVYQQDGPGQLYIQVRKNLKEEIWNPVN